MGPAAFLAIPCCVIWSVALYFSHLSFKYGGWLGVHLRAKVLKRLEPLEGRYAKGFKRSIEVCLVKLASGEVGLGILISHPQLIGRNYTGLSFSREATLDWCAGLRGILESGDFETSIPEPGKRSFFGEWNSTLPSSFHFGESVDRLLHGVTAQRKHFSNQCIRIFRLGGSLRGSRGFGIDFSNGIFTSWGFEPVVLSEVRLREHLRQIESLSLESL